MTNDKYKTPGELAGAVVGPVLDSQIDRGRVGIAEECNGHPLKRILLEGYECPTLIEKVKVE